MNTNKKLSFLLGVIDANAFKQPTYNHVTFVRTSSQQFANELAFLGAMVGNKTNVFIPSIDLGEFSVIFEVNFSTCGWFEGFFLDYSLLEMHVNTCSNCDCEVTPEKFTKVQSVESQKTNSDIDSLHAIFTSGTYACLMTTQGAPIFI